MKSLWLMSIASLMMCSCGMVTAEDLSFLGVGSSKDKSSTAKGGAAVNDSSSMANIKLQLFDKGNSTYLQLVSLFEPGSLFSLADFNSGFSLAAPSSVTFGISGCVSGFTATGLNDVDFDVALKLYKHDRSCVAGLESFVFHGHYENADISYAPLIAGGLPLKGILGDSQIYAEVGDQTNKVMVTVIKQLESVVVDADYASFSFKRILAGVVDAQPWADYSDSNTLRVYGVEAPNASIGNAAVTLTDIDADGVGVFSVNFTCGQNMTDPGTGYVCPTKAAGGDNQKLSDMCAVLVIDTYGGAPTYVESEAATTASCPIVPTYSTATVFQAAALKIGTGAGNELYTHKNMLLFLRYHDAVYGNSYRYFNVDIGAPSASP